MNTVESPSSDSSSPPVRHRFPRRALIGAAAALSICAVLVIGLVRPGTAPASPASPSTPTSPGSVSEAPNLPPGFTDTFTDRYVDVGGVRLHAVVGGHGRPLLLIHGWPQTWYAWRLLMPHWPATSKSLPSTNAASGCPTNPRTDTTPAPRPTT